LKIEWTPALSVGIGEIDSQHREFISMIAALPEDIKKTGHSINALETVKNLEEYAEKHFSTEEMYMSIYAYPESQAHKDLHDMFRAEIGVMKEKALQDASADTVNGINSQIYQWFLNHIIKTDMKLGVFLKAKLR